MNTLLGWNWGDQSRGRGAAVKMPGMKHRHRAMKSRRWRTAQALGRLPAMANYSFFGLLRHAFSGHANWPRAWRDPPLKKRYDVAIVGAGGQGLATAYYLASRHGVRDVAVIDKGWIGGGNTGRNTVTIRANYLREPSIRFHAEGLRMWRELSGALGFNVMFSERGQLDLIQTWAKLRDVKRRQSTMRLAGVPFEIVTPAEARKRLPILAPSGPARLPILAATWHPTAGVARHDAVAWGYARAADALGVDIVQNCEVLSVRREGGRVIGVETARGFVEAPKIGLAVSAHASVLAASAGLRLPIETVPLQAFVSEPLKPMLDCIVNCPGQVYLSQTDKGELAIGGGSDAVPSYVQRGDLATIERVVTALVELFPVLGRVRMLRQWAGAIDLCHDTSPILSKTPVDGLYLDAGWGSGGFKAIPAGGAAFARLIANDAPEDSILPFALSRFERGRPLYETAGASNRD
jgi:sarcosine oxidase subunit beta